MPMQVQSNSRPARLFHYLAHQWQHGQADETSRHNLRLATDYAVQWIKDGKLPNDKQLRGLLKIR